MLVEGNRDIEAEQLVMKLASDSSRVHGPGHNCTKCVDKLLEKLERNAPRDVLMPPPLPYQSPEFSSRPSLLSQPAECGRNDVAVGS